MEQISVLLRDRDWIVVAGLFDPLTAAEAKRLATYGTDGQKLALIVVEEPGTLLDVEARARLVAALASVSAVAIGAEGWREHVHAPIIEDLEAGRARRQEFMETVQRRGSAP